MAKERPWTVLPHDPLEKLAPNLWCVDGASPAPIRRRAMIVRLAGGKLVFMNAVPVDDAALRELEAWGEPGYLVVPNGFHRLDLVPFKKRWPGLKVLTPPESARRVSERVPVDGTLDDLPADPGLSTIKLRGVKTGEAVHVVDDGGKKTVLVPGDAIFNVPHEGGFAGVIMRLIGSSGGPRVTFVARKLMVSDTAALAGSIRELAALPGLARVVVCHGRHIDGDAAAVLRSVADRLAP